MHVCPAFDGIVPHVGGPVMPPGCPTVLIGELPAARVGDMLTCVGPPDTIVKGSAGVLIGGQPAARMLDSCAHGGVILLGCFTVLIGDVGGGGGGGGAAPAPASPPPAATGLGDDVDAIAAKSPILEANIKALQASGWAISYGPAGKGSYTDRKAKQIVIDSSQKNSPTSVVQTLAHESGHARYTPDPYTPPTGLTKDQYVQANVDHSLKDEGEATMTNVQVRDQILQNGGPDIGVAGAQSSQYEAIAQQYPNPSQRDQAREAIGQVFANGEHPSTDPSSTYGQYYAKPFSDYWDNNVAKKP